MMRRILIGLLVVIIIIVGGALGAFYLTPSSTIASYAADQVRDTTGRTLVIDGPIERRLYPALGFSVGAVRLSNADWADEPDMIAAEGASVDIRIVPLIGGGVEVADFKLVKPVIRLERREDGSANWDDLAADDLAADGGDAAGSGGGGSGGGDGAADDPLALIVENAVIEDGLFVLEDAESGQSIEMTDINLAVSLPAIDGALDVQGSAVVNGAPASLSAALDSIAAVQAGRTARAEVSVSGDGLAVSFNGAVGDVTGAARLPEANGDLALSLDADRERTAWLRDALGEGFQDIGGVAATGAFSVSESAIALDLTADADIRERPTKVIAQIGGGEGWMTGGSELQIVASATNAALDVGYDGVARMAEDGAPTVRGAWRGRIDDVPGAFALVGAPPPAPGEPLAALSRVDMTGEIDLTPAQVQASVDGGIAIAGRDVQIRGDVAAEGAGWESGAQPIRIDVSATGAALDIGYDGELRLAESGAPTVRGAWRSRVNDMPAALALAGLPTPAEGEPLAQLSSVDLSGQVDMTPEQLLASLGGVIGFNAREVSVNGDVSGGGDWATGGPIRADLSAASAELFSASWAGSVAAPASGGVTPEIDGRFEFDSSALRSMMAWLGADPVDAPPGSFRSAAIGTNIAVTPTRTRLSATEIKLDDAVVTGEVTVETEPDAKPTISARVATNALDLRPYTGFAASAGGGGGGSSGGAPATTPAAAGQSGGSGWSEEPLDLSVLDLIDAQLFVSTEGVATDFITVERSRAEVTLAGGRLDLEIPELGLHGGSVTGSAALDGSSTPSIDLDITAEQVALGPFLSQSAGLDWIEGDGAARIDVAGAGRTTKELMSSLNGDASMSLTNGAIIGFNLAAIVRNVTSLGLRRSETPQKTDFAEISGSFQIADGVAQNNDLLLVGPLVRLTGAGSIDIGDQSLNYRAVPKAVATLRGQGGTKDLAGLAFPVLISGPWADPSIRPDLSGGAVASVEGILADPQGAAAFLSEIDGVGEVLEGLTGGDGDVEGAVGGAIDSLLGGGDGDQGGVEEAVGGALDSLLGGGAEGDGEGDEGGVEDAVGGALDSLLGGGAEGEDKPDPGRALRGLFGN